MSRTLPDALVLTAGLGTRLQPLTLVRAKPAIPLAGIPLAERIIRWLVSHGVHRLVLNLHFKPDTITRVIGDGRHLGAHVRYSWEYPDLLGSAGGPRMAAPIVGAETFLIVNGDTLTDIDLGALTAAHERRGALVTMALVPNTAPERYGGVTLDANGAVVGFATRGPSAVGTFHFLGVQVAAARAFASVTPGRIANSVGEVYDQLIAERPGSIRGHVCDAAFWDIGSVTDYWRTSLAFAEDGQATLGRGVNTRIDATARLHNTIVWDGVTIGPGASLDGCIVTDDVTVAAGGEFRDVILTTAPDGQLTVTPRPIP